MKQANKRRWVWPLLFLFLFLFYLSIPGLTGEDPIVHSESGTDNTKDFIGAKAPLVSGERLKYQVYVKGWLVGEQILSIIGESYYQEQPIIHIHMDLRSYAAYSLFFSYQESGDLFLDPETLTPIYLRKTIKDKDQSWIEEYLFEVEEERVEKRIIRNGKTEKKSYLQVNQPLLESLSLIYYLRGRPWQKEQYQFYFLSSSAPIPVNFQYRGQEKIRVLSKYMMADFIEDPVSRISVWFSTDEKAYPLKIVVHEKIGTFTSRLVEISYIEKE